MENVEHLKGKPLTVHVEGETIKIGTITDARTKPTGLLLAATITDPAWAKALGCKQVGHLGADDS